MMISNAVQQANQMLRTMPIPSGEYFMTSLAFSSLNPRDARQVLQNNVPINQYTPTQNVMNNSLQDVGQSANQIDKMKINQYLSRSDVQTQLQNRTFLPELANTNLPNNYRKILVQVPHLTSAQILHKFNEDNIAKQSQVPTLTLYQHSKYQSILNQGMQLGNKLSPVGLNYLKKSINIYQKHPALLYALKNRNTNDLVTADLDAYQDLRNTVNGNIQENGQDKQIQPSVNNQEYAMVNQYVYNLPKQVLQTRDLSELMSQDSSIDETDIDTSQGTQFVKQFSIMTPQEQQCYKYLIFQSQQSYKDVQSILSGQVTNSATMIKQQQLHKLIQGQDEAGNQKYNALTPQQNQQIHNFFMDSNNEMALKNGTYYKALYKYEYGSSSINDIVHKALTSNPINYKQTKTGLETLMKQYKGLDRQSQKYMRLITKEYAYNPQSFERQYIANMSGNPHMISALSHSEKKNWQHIQDVAQGKEVINGQIINTGTTAQHKLDVDYLISKPQYRNIFRNGDLNKLFVKDKEIQELSANKPRLTNKLANTVHNNPYNTFATLHTHHLKKMLQQHITHPNTQPQQSPSIKQEPQSRKSRTQ